MLISTARVIRASSVAILLGAPNCKTTREKVEQLWCDGSRAFIQHTPGGYEKAAAAYSQALTLEKTKRVLSRNAWFVLIDNLGMAYGISGDLPKSRATLEYGVSVEPSYPMFYYNLACASAESGDKQKALEYLQQAFERRANIIPGETMPEPSTDDSFQRFMSDPQFVAALKALPRS
jgi:tetratricopeptide (TPR) repeat protein